MSRVQFYSEGPHQIDVPGFEVHYGGQILSKILSGEQLKKRFRNQRSESGLLVLVEMQARFIRSGMQNRGSENVHIGHIKVPVEFRHKSKVVFVSVLQTQGSIR